MSCYFVKGKSWRYDFLQKGVRYTSNWFPSKKEAQRAEAKRKEEIKNPKPEVETPTQTDMGFFDLLNRRLDHVKAYNSIDHYRNYRYMAKRWVKRWGTLSVSQISREMVENLIRERRKVSPYTANQELRYLKAAFNFGIKKGLTVTNPAQGVDFFPVDKKIKYVPPSEDIDKVISIADPEARDYLMTIRETMGRVSEINRLTWDDVDLSRKTVVLYTRKKRGGHLTPRTVPMTERLFQILSRRYANRDQDKPWVYWHKYWSKNGNNQVGPYKDRKKIMRSLCEGAGVKYFRYHALRHSGASIMDLKNVPIGVIQRILGHENRETTEIYLHTIGQPERQAMETYEKATQKSHIKSHIARDERPSTVH
jgi:integrase